LSTIQTVSLVLGIIYYLTIMRNTQKNQQMQLETRQAQVFMSVYNKLNDPVTQESFNDILELEFTTFNEFNELGEGEEEYQRTNRKKMLHVISYLEGVGVLVKEGILDIRWIALLMGGWTRKMWEKMIPIVEEGREFYGSPRWFSETEYLYHELMKYVKDHPELES